jgi:hypothetical protein
MSEALSDLRSEVRKPSEKTISVKYANDYQGGCEEVHVCRSQDISAGGIKLISHKPLALGSEMPMEIDLGSMWAVIDTTAEVKWCLEIDETPTYYIGIKLIDINKPNLQVWQKFIEKL